MERTVKIDGSSFGEYLGYARAGVKRFFTEDRQLWISFAAPCLILLISYFIFGVFPFGDNSVLSLDLNGQYVYYYDYMYDVFAGKESIFYSWSRNLSGEFMGIIGYYLASPFNLLVWAFPRECITEGLLTMMVTKVGAIGFCTAIYLSRGLITMKVGETAQLNSYLDDGYTASNRTYRTSNEKVVQMLSTY